MKIQLTAALMLLLSPFQTSGLDDQVTPEQRRQVEPALPAKAAARAAKPRKLLVMTLNVRDGKEGKGHASIPAGNLALRLMGEKTGAYEAVFSNDLALLRPENLNKFDAICFNNTVGVLTEDPALRKSLLDFIAGGKGFVGIHAAGATFVQWPRYDQFPEFGEMLGGYENGGHPWKPDETIVLRVEDRESPLNAGFKTEEFEISDEVFQFQAPYYRKKLTVLLSIDTERTDMNPARRFLPERWADRDFAISWIKQYGRGRVFYSSLGHNPAIFWNGPVLEHFLAGIQFALGDLEADPDKLESLLSRIRNYDYGMGRENLLAFSDYLRERTGNREELSRIEKQLVALLGSDASPAAKDFACRQLSLIGTEASVPALSRLLVVPATSDAARYALERIPGEAVDKALRDALPASSGRTRVGIINTLGERRDHRAVPLLVPMLASPDTVEAAAASLGRIGDKAAVNALFERKTTADGRLRMLIQEALMDVADELIVEGKVKEAILIYRDMVFRNEPVSIRIAGYTGLARALGPNGIPMLVTTVKEEEPDVQAAAINLLLDFRVPGVTEQLLRIMPDLPSRTKARLLVAMGDYEQRVAASVVLDAARDESNAEVREAAVRALANLGDGSCVSLLAGIATDSTGALQEAARNSLYRMRGQDVDQAVSSSIGTAAPPVRVELLRAVAERNIRPAAESVAQMLRHEDAAVRREAIKTLRDVGDEGQVSALVTFLDGTQVAAERTEAERALSFILRRVAGRGLPSVIAGYKQSKVPEIRESFLTVLGGVGAPEALPVLREALRDGEPGVRRAAIVSLGEWPDASPLPDLLSAASETQEPAHHVLALRSYLKLVALPNERTSADSVKLLAAAMKAAREIELKKAVLAALPRFICTEALDLATSAAENPELKAEAEQAVKLIREGLSYRR